MIDWFGGWETNFDFSYDDKNRIVTETGDDRETYVHKYDENGNLLAITSNNTAIIRFGINGNLRFETTSPGQHVYHNYRYDNNGVLSELFKAPDGDIRNPMPMYK